MRRESQRLKMKSTCDAMFALRWERSGLSLGGFFALPPVSPTQSVFIGTADLRVQESYCGLLLAPQSVRRQPRAALTARLGRLS